MFIHVVDRIQAHAFVEVKSLFPCCLLAECHSQLQEEAVGIERSSIFKASKEGGVPLLPSLLPHHYVFFLLFLFLSAHIMVPNINHICNAPFTV